MVDKVTIRRFIKNSKVYMSPLYIEQASRHITTNLERHPRFISAQRICIFNALHDEPQTLGLIERWASVKEIYLPVIRDGIIVLSKFISRELLQSGLYNIKEPMSDNLLSEYNTLDLIVIPGVAFDINGGRIGRGKGYYDVLLSNPQFKDVYKIGLCFAFQKFEKLPTQAHDIRVDEVI
jgi:5-formyltetrahydrofolate cyclo-ligase